jgi:hypothetical protein
MAMNVDRVVINGVDISGTVVQAVLTFKVEAHGEERIVTRKFDAPRDGGVLETLLGPLDEDVAWSQDSRRGNNSFNHVCAIKASLIVSGPVGEREWE